MTTQHIYLSDLHYEHRLWTNQLTFYKEEIGLFEQYLGDAAVNRTDMDSRSQVEHLQNQFIRQKEVIDELVHDIKLHEQNLAEFAKANPVAIEHRYFGDHTGFRDRMEMFDKLYRELKIEFKQFMVSSK